MEGLHLLQCGAFLLGKASAPAAEMARRRLRILKNTATPRSREERRRSVMALEAMYIDVVCAVAPELFIEIGAKDPAVARRVRHLLPGAQVLAFEANPHTFRRFARKRDHAALGVDYRNVAVCDRKGMVSFNVRRRVDGRPSADGQGSLLMRDDYEPGYSVVTVPATTLDAVLEEEAAHVAQCALWIDVEGASREVLSGGQELLRRASAILIEVETAHVWKRQWLVEEVSDCLCEAGLYPVARDFQHVHQYNLLFVRRSLLADEQFQRLLMRAQKDAGLGSSGPLARRTQRLEWRLVARGGLNVHIAEPPR